MLPLSARRYPSVVSPGSGLGRSPTDSACPARRCHSRHHLAEGRAVDLKVSSTLPSRPAVMGRKSSCSSGGSRRAP